MSDEDGLERMDTGPRLTVGDATESGRVAGPTRDLVQRQAKDFGCRSAEATTIHGWPEKHDPNSLA
jgi:hypothetical protein